MATNEPVQTCTSKETSDGSEKKKCFTFIVTNLLREPYIDNSDSMEIDEEIEDKKSPLIRYMKKAVKERKGLMDNFTVTYFSGLGYFIEAINGVRGTYSVDKSSWQIKTELGKTNLGISFFKPEDGMEVVLDLVAGQQCDDKKRFTFTVKNKLRKPFFNNSVAMEEAENSPLIRYMKKAVDENNGLMKKFTVTYETNSKYKIEAINDVKETSLPDNSSWKMRTQYEPVQMGISSFIPKDGMHVVLYLVAGQCDKRKRFTFTVKYKLSEKPFNESVTMEIEDEKSKLITYMKKAADEKNGLMEKFTVTYVPDGKYLLDAINDAKATPLADNSSWKLRTQLGPTQTTQTGTCICSFIPEDGMNVILELNGPDDN